MRGWTIKTATKHSPEVRELAVRKMLEQQNERGSEWVVICWIAAKIGFTAEKLRHWVGQSEHDNDQGEGQTNSERDRIKALELEVRKLRQANEILCKDSLYFVQAELTPRYRP